MKEQDITKVEFLLTCNENIVVQRFFNVRGFNKNTSKSESLHIFISQLCNEIYLYNDEQHTFVCCLSSVNLARYDEWKNDANFLKDCNNILDFFKELASPICNAKG